MIMTEKDKEDLKQQIGLNTPSCFDELFSFVIQIEREQRETNMGKIYSHLSEISEERPFFYIKGEISEYVSIELHKNDYLVLTYETKEKEKWSIISTKPLEIQNRPFQMSDLELVKELGKEYRVKAESFSEASAVLLRNRDAHAHVWITADSEPIIDKNDDEKIF
jgi:hypothetical protein